MAEEEKARYPPGMRLMPEEERLETLHDLLDSKKEVNTALERMPVVLKTIKAERHKKDLENKMIKIDKAIITF